MDIIRRYKSIVYKLQPLRLYIIKGAWCPTSFVDFETLGTTTDCWLRSSVQAKSISSKKQKRTKRKKKDVFIFQILRNLNIILKK